MSDQEMTIVHEEGDETAARIVIGYLRSHGIDARISEDDAGDQLPSFEGVHGVQVFVPVAEAARARELLARRAAD